MPVSSERGAGVISDSARIAACAIGGRRRRLLDRGPLARAAAEALEGRVLLAAVPTDTALADPGTSVTYGSQNASAVVVSIPDANLQAVIRLALGKPTGDITDVDMATLTGLTAASASIVSLSGLEYATNLRSLEFSDNQISDVTPLAGLTQLQQLQLGSNQIGSVSPLAGLTQLRQLLLSSNQIGNVLPLAGLTQLRTLHLSNNQISDLTPLAGLTQLRQLHLGSNQISDLTPLAGLTQLTTLRLGYNGLSDLAPLAGLTQLTALYLQNNQLSDLTPLAGLTQLAILDLAGNQLSDLAPLAGLTQLTTLYLPGNQISDPTPLAGLTQLATLDLEGNQISDLAPLAGLTQLNWVNVSHNNLDLTSGSASMLVIQGWISQGATVIYLSDVDEIAPTVTAVYVRGSTWASGYLSFLAANTSGSSATYGYAIPVGSGAAQLQTLPWRNLNRISIAFSEDVSIAQAQFAIAGSVGSYSVSGFAYSSIDHVATWSLSSAIGPDKLYAALPGSGTTPVRDAAGNVLDGEWSNPSSYSDSSSTDTFPSGNGVAGGDFAFRFDVLPGDSSGGSLGKVNVADVAQSKGRSSLPVSTVTYRSDFDGNNLVNVADVAYVKSKSSVYSLPVNPPVVPVFGPVFSQVSLLQKDRSLNLW